MENTPNNTEKKYGKRTLIIAMVLSFMVGFVASNVRHNLSQKNQNTPTVYLTDPMPNYQPPLPPATTYEPEQQQMGQQQETDPHITLNISGNVNTPVTIVCGRGILEQKK